MHERETAEELLALVLERACGERVRAVVAHVGPRAGVVPAALRYFFAAAATGTRAEDATLELIETNRLGLCPGCGRVPRIGVVQERSRCECGRAALTDDAGLEGGDVRLERVEVGG